MSVFGSDFFYIGSGQGNCMYTLRHCYSENWGKYIVNRNHYWCNLSTNWDAAVEKAKAIVAEFNSTHKANAPLKSNEEFDLNEWGTAGSAKGWQDPRTEEQKQFDEAYREAWAENILRSQQERDEAIKAQRQKSRHFGTIGDRKEFELTVDLIRAFDHRIYGVSYMYLMTDADGNCFKYFGKVDLGKENDKITLIATIKKHEEFVHNQWNEKEEYEQEQTVLARPKVITIFNLEEEE